MSTYELLIMKKLQEEEEERKSKIVEGIFNLLSSQMKQFLGGADNG